jgi:hypothetical protein
LEEIKNRLKVLERKIDKSKRQTGPDMDGEKMHPEREKPKFLKGTGDSLNKDFYTRKTNSSLKTKELRWKKTENYLRNSLKPLILVMKFKLNLYFFPLPFPTTQREQPTIRRTS